MPSNHARQNALLAQLEPAVLSRLLQGAELVDLRARATVFDEAVPATRLYFPLSGVVSLMRTLSSGEVGEVAMVGAEGVLGLALLTDAEPMPMRALVQLPGLAIAPSAGRVQEEFLRGGAFQVLMFRHVRALSAQMGQISMCTRRHSVEQQLVRWLLGACDRVPGDNLRVTHEAIAEALCVRRVSVTDAFARLQQAGLVQCSRRLVRIVDHQGLADAGCECHAAIRDDLRRIHGHAPHSECEETPAAPQAES